MLAKIIEYSGRNRFLILILTSLLAGWGIYALYNTPLDAIPDLSDSQVIIYSEWAGQSPKEIEDQITYPLTTSMLSVPRVKKVRGYSDFGFSLVYVIFEDGTDLYWARSRVLEYLNYVSGRLPKDAVTSLGPDATGVGWVFQYTLESKNHNLGELRAIQDWYVKYQLSTVPGVAEVASIGGFVMQYQIQVFPDKLLAYNIPLEKVTNAVMDSNVQSGGHVLELGEKEYMIRGLGYINSLDDIRNISLDVDEKGVPITVGDIAMVTRGPDARRGLAEKNGEGEVVGGIVVMRYGENALAVIKRVKEKIKQIQPGLPVGVTIVPNYDRSKLIERAIAFLNNKLVEECIVVILVCILFLWHFPSSLIIIITLPIGILFSFVVMHRMGINANIMSLGGIAIAIGAMVDAAIVMIENAHKMIEHSNARGEKVDRTTLVLNAAKQVGPTLFFALIIIVVSFLPVFTLQAQEGRLFKPLAYTKTFAMLGASILSITLVPVLMTIFLRGHITPERKNPLNWLLITLYRPVIWLVLRMKGPVMVIALLILLLTIFPLQKLGSEFMPPLNEGDLLYMPTTFPGISITEAKKLLQQTDKVIKKIPEVDIVFGKAGRADTATDPASMSMLETTIVLKDPKDWAPGRTINDIVKDLESNMQIPGLANSFTMPIKTRIDMLSTGIKTPVGIKIYGNTLEDIQKLGSELERVIKNVPHTVSVFSDRTEGGNYIDIEIDRKEASRYGLNVGDVQNIIKTGIGGMNMTWTVEGRERFPVSLRYARDYREDLDELKRVLIPTPSGQNIPIGQLARIEVKTGPSMIKSENALLQGLTVVSIDDEIDIGTYVRNAKKTVEENVMFPPGTYIEWSGQYEYMVSANQRLRIVIPVVLFLIFILLYFNFKNMTDTLIVMLTLPFAAVGGIWMMYFLDFSVSVAVWIGFIALMGVAAETGVVMILYLDIAWKEKLLETGGKPSMRDLYSAVMHGAVERVRPKMMTVSVIIVGLLPLMVGEGTGAEVMKRIATPMVGGMVSSTILTLIVIPAVYAWVKGWGITGRLWKDMLFHKPGPETEIEQEPGA
ncbi:MAG: CusA/CzcA family heavy metal efflux RND transporter [Chloroflexi bacterium]|nr:CusA/CzcA family heavy metal efflux RND transporter [Chloroflexota bacterium]